MTLDSDRIDEAVLALLYLGLHSGTRAWKGFDWDAMNRLHEKRFISDPRGKAKSVVFSEEGLAEARRLLEKLFSAETQRLTVPAQTIRQDAVKAKDRILNFRVNLRGVEPDVWRVIAVPATYSFWDLHVAVQDGMGWLDYHLHVFRIRNPETRNVDKIGIPEDDSFEDDLQFLPGWEIRVVKYFTKPGDRADYEYDFGDGWQHEIVLEAVTRRIPRKRYPVCIDGARACPPEDCGGAHGYEKMLAILQDPDHEEHDSMLQWVGGRYDASAFAPGKIRFDNPKVP